MKSLTKRQTAIIQALYSSPGCSITKLRETLGSAIDKTSYATLSRDLNVLIDEGFVVRKGYGRASAYRATPRANVMMPIDVDAYFKLEPDERPALARFQHGIFELLEASPIFTNNERSLLERLEKEYKTQSSGLSPIIMSKEWERITIEFSWKSSSIEGNTYSLLETENLLQHGTAAPGKSKEETMMILNHKTALVFIREQTELFRNLSISLIEQVHSILIGELNIKTNLRKTLVGITGTKYKPLDNEYQIREAMDKMLSLINRRKCAFEKSILAILLISYIQPFEDGNKRTSRLIGNAILLAWDKFPLSFRSVNNNDYKKAILLFYELNNAFSFKEIFLKQAEFSVTTYFRSRAD